MNLTDSQYIGDIQIDAPEFQQALTLAGPIVKAAGFRVGSRHHHFLILPGEVMVEALVSWPRRGVLGELKLFPLPEEEARTKGLPSCWAFTPDGTPVVLRYADYRLHDGCGIDVMSDEFQTKLATTGRAFVAQNKGLNEMLEVNIAGALLRGAVTRERTDEATRTQEVLFGPPGTDFQLGPDAMAACWDFTFDVEALVSTWCIGCPDEPQKPPQLSHVVR